MIERYKPLFAEETRALKQANEDLLNEQRRLKSENERLQGERADLERRLKSSENER